MLSCFSNVSLMFHVKQIILSETCLVSRETISILNKPYSVFTLATDRRKPL